MKREWDGSEGLEDTEEWPELAAENGPEEERPTPIPLMFKLFRLISRELFLLGPLGPRFWFGCSWELEEPLELEELLELLLEPLLEFPEPELALEEEPELLFAADNGDLKSVLLMEEPSFEAEEDPRKFCSRPPKGEPAFVLSAEE